MRGDSIAAVRGVLKEWPEAHGWRKGVRDPSFLFDLAGPDLGEGRSSNQKDYIMYLERGLDPALFVPPPQCANAKVLTWGEISAMPGLTLD